MSGNIADFFLLSNQVNLNDDVVVEHCNQVMENGGSLKGATNNQAGVRRFNKSDSGSPERFESYTTSVCIKGNNFFRGDKKRQPQALKIFFFDCISMALNEKTTQKIDKLLHATTFIVIDLKWPDF